MIQPNAEISSFCQTELYPWRACKLPSCFCKYCSIPMHCSDAADAGTYFYEIIVFCSQQELGMPFKKWLQKHNLHLILPLFYETQTSQGYGFIEEVPTYYGAP